MSVTNLDLRRPNTKTAYLVAHLDTSAWPPVVVRTGIYSEPASSLSGAIGRGRFAVNVWEETGPSFEEAQRRIIDMPSPWRSMFEWALDLLPEHLGAERAVPRSEDDGG